jgi:hypothetical protein
MHVRAVGAAAVGGTLMAGTPDSDPPIVMRVTVSTQFRNPRTISMRNSPGSRKVELL